MMIIVGDALLGQGHGKYFMLAEAITVFLALIGTTLSCMNTGARVTYAMGKDDEAPEHFGILHAGVAVAAQGHLDAGWISAVIGVIAVSLVFGDAGAPTDATIAALPHGIFSSFGYLSHDHAGGAAQLAAHHHPHLQLRHLHPLRAQLLPVHRGLPRAPRLQLGQAPAHSRLRPLANLVCMGFYLIGPVFGLGTFKEPLLALGISAVWGIYGAIYFLRSSKAKGKAVLLTSKNSLSKPHINRTQPLGGISFSISF
jgi:basic amino acid/polyamine antiporter, APA family